MVAGYVVYNRPIKSMAVISYNPKSISYMFATFNSELKNKKKKKVHTKTSSTDATPNSER